IDTPRGAHGFGYDPHFGSVSKELISLETGSDGSEKSDVCRETETSSIPLRHYPHFFVPALGKTAAELRPPLKNSLSHRGHALRSLLKALQSHPETDMI